MYRSIKILFAALIILLGFGEPAVAALNLSNPVARPDSLAEAVRMDAMLHRLGNDHAVIRAEIQDLSRLYPDRDFALLEILIDLQRIENPEILRNLLTARDFTGLGFQADLEPAAWEFLTATSLYYGNRYRSALTLFEQLAPTKPDWPWLQYFIFSCKSFLFFPDDQLQPHMDRALEYPGPRTEILRFLFRQTYDGFTPEFHQQVLEAMRRQLLTPQTSMYLDINRHALALGAEAPSASALEAAWRSFVNDHGDLAFAYAYSFFRYMPLGVPLVDQLELYNRLIAEGQFTDDLELLKAGLLFDLAESDSVLEIVANQDQPSNFSRFLALATQLRLARSSALVSLLDDPADESCLTTFSGDQEWAYSILGRRNDFAALWAESEVENPVRNFEHRLTKATPEARNQVAALLDSLAGLGNSVISFSDEIFRLREASGDTMPLQEILALPNRNLATRLLRNAAMAARNRGDQNRQTAARALQVEHGLGDLQDFTDILRAAWSMRNHKLALAALELVEQEIPPNHPYALYWRIGNARAFDGPDAALAFARSLDVSTVNDANLCGTLASIFLGNGWLPEAEAALQRSLELAPDAGWPLYVQAKLFMARQQNREAEKILLDLSAQFPGSEKYISDLLIVGKSTMTMDDIPVAGFEYQQDFARFGYEIGGQEYLEGLRLSAEELEGLPGDVVTIFKKTTILLDGLASYRQRLRLVGQIKTELGAEKNRTQVISFDPNDGYPRVLAARVLTPGGKLLTIPPSQILIRAPKDENSDVTDQREMVIPMGNVSPGAIIDLAYETGSTFPLLTGYSTRFHFPDDIPVKTSIFEIWHSEELPLTVIKNSENIEDTTDPETGVRRLVMHDLPAAEGIFNAGNILDILPCVSVTTNTSWDQVAASYSSLFWPLASPTEKITKLARDLTAEAGSKEEKVEAVFRFIKKEIKGLAVELGAGRFVPSPPDEVLDRSWGDCKDLSCLMISMLAALDIDARPVLVASGNTPLPRQDFPNLFVFNHMIVQVNEIDDDFYCDPLNGRGCADNLPVNSSGKLGLHLDPKSNSKLIEVVPRHGEEHGFDIQTDAYPLAEGHMRYQVNGVFRGAAADYMRPYFTYGDSNAVNWILATSLGYGLPQVATLLNWKIEDTDCDRFAVSATFLDTTWTHPAASEGMITCVNEAADYWGLPEAEGRKYDVQIPSPYDNRFVLRLHESDVWKPSDEISGYKAESDDYKARFKQDSGHDGDDRYVEIVQEFQLKKKLIPLGRYQEFMDAAIRFKLHAARAYKYRKVYDSAKLDGIRQYVRENPDDLGFLGNSVMHVLGSDMGGTGEEGKDRREFARSLIMPLGDELTNQPLLTLLAATTLIKDGKWTAADSLGEVALAKNPASTELLNVMATVKRELDQFEQQAVLLKKLNNLQGDLETSYDLIVCSLTLGDQDEVRKQINRMELMGAKIDPGILLLLRLQAAYQAYDYEETNAILIELEGKIDADRLALLRTDDLMQSNRFQEALEPYEKSWRENPTSSILCNNLAWIYGMLGVKLNLAYDLAEASAVMSLDSSSSLHTMGTILARRHEWKKAQAIFEQSFRENDKPSDRMVNGLFFGLCRYSLGDKEEARVIWEQLDGLVKEKFWVDALTECRRRDEADLDPWGAVFTDLELEDEG